jgi:hypothetical protein
LRGFGTGARLLPWPNPGPRFGLLASWIGAHGDAWTWTALDVDSKLIVRYLIGGRHAEAAQDFMHDVANRLANRVQLTTDGHGVYLNAVLGAFGIDVDYAMLVKLDGPTPVVCQARSCPGRPLAKRKKTV